MALLFQSPKLSGATGPEYTQEFVSQMQPYIIKVYGDFRAKSLTAPHPRIAVEYRNASGDWVELTGYVFDGKTEVPLREAPGVMLRVKVQHCQAAQIEVHDSTKVAI